MASDSPSSLLDPSQRAAVEHPGGPLLVVAGPGSGKTRVLTHRVAQLLEWGNAPEEILAVTFTNKAAGELRERLNRLVGAEIASRIVCGTFHSVAARILRAEHDSVGLPRSFSILDTGDVDRMLTRIAKAVGAVDQREARDYARAARRDISRVKNQGFRLETLADSSTLPRIATVAAHYEQEKQQAGAADFDDLLLLCRQVVMSDSEVGERWRARFQHVLVDEYQDTNPTQATIVKQLADRSQNLTAVGDIDQSIYAFRAADPRVMASFETEWPGATVIKLAGNYRSTPEIVAVCEAIIKGNPAEHRAAQTAFQASGEPVTLEEFRNDLAEAEHIASTVKRSTRPLSDFAVLVRVNSQTRAVEEALVKKGVEYHLVGGQRFFDRAEVKDTLSWVRAAVNPRDVAAFERAAAVPRRGVGPALVQQVAEHATANACTLVEAAEQLAGSIPRGSTLATLGADLRQVRNVLASEGLSAGINAILALGVRSQWERASDGNTRLENLDELVRAAAEFCTAGTDPSGASISELAPPRQVVAFLEHVALLNSTDSEAGPAVSVLTVHAAKGREWPVVFVAGLEEKLFPHALATSASDIQEERRLFFVAASRAQQELHLSLCAQRLLFGKKVSTLPSRFLKGLPSSVVRRLGGAGPSRSVPLSHRTKPQMAGAASGGWESDARRAARRRREERRKQRASGSANILSASEATVGVRVRHPQFGVGTIVAVQGDDLKVKFTSGVRLLGRTIAPLEILD